MKTAMRAKDCAAPVGDPPACSPRSSRGKSTSASSSTTPTSSAILEKMIKQRRDSIAQFEKAGRDDLADAEKFELGS